MYVHVSRSNKTHKRETRLLVYGNEKAQTTQSLLLAYSADGWVFRAATAYKNVYI